MFTDSILTLIGNTPLIRLRGERIYAKAEFLNPGGSIKDRVAVAMIEGAERRGELKPDSVIVEPSSWCWWAGSRATACASSCPRE